MQILTYTMYGRSVRVFPFPPNWSSPVNESLEWKTDVLRSRNGLEQRRALRVKPRRGFDYKILAYKRYATMLESLLWNWQHRYFAVPVWTDVGKLTAGVAQGSASLPMSTTNLSFRADDYLIIFNKPDDYEVIGIQSVASNSISLKVITGKAWPAGTKVFPIAVMHMGNSVTLSRHNSSVLESSGVSFIGSADLVYDFIDDVSAAPTLYDGIELVTAKPNWGATLDNEFSRAFDTLDAGVGPLAYYETERTGRILKPFNWFLKSRADIVAFRNFVGRQRGQAKSFWMPSWHDDFELAQSNSGDTSILTVKGTEFQNLVDVDTSRDRLSIRLPDGSYRYRRIVGMTVSYLNDITSFQLDSALGTVVSPNQSVTIQLLLRCRLASDKVIIPWVTDQFANPKTTMTTIKV